MSQDIVADALNMMKNAKRARKEVVKLKIISNLLIEVLKIMKQEGAVKKYKIDAKNKGKIDMYFVNGIKSQYSHDEDGVIPNRKFIEVLNNM